MLKDMIVLYFQILKKGREIGLIAIRRFVNTRLIYVNVRIEVVVNHHELLMLLNFYH